MKQKNSSILYNEYKYLNSSVISILLQRANEIKWLTYFTSSLITCIKITHKIKSFLLKYTDLISVIIIFYSHWCYS